MGKQPRQGHLGQEIPRAPRPKYGRMRRTPRPGVASEAGEVEEQGADLQTNTPQLGGYRSALLEASRRAAACSPLKK